MESFARRIIDWYDRGHRDFPWRNTKDPYHIWVSEIMLQQTRAETVVSYYNRFMARFPTLEALANAKETELLKAWEGLGYYSRARNLQKCAVQALTEYGGHFPETPEELMRLPGIGPYTAGAVASIAFGCRCSAVDGNVLRVMARVEGIEDDIRRPETVRLIRERTDARLPDRDCDRFSNAMMELGPASVCPGIRSAKSVRWPICVRHGKPADRNSCRCAPKPNPSGWKIGISFFFILMTGYWWSDRGRDFLRACIPFPA